MLAPLMLVLLLLKSPPFTLKAMEFWGFPPPTCCGAGVVKPGTTLYMLSNFAPFLWEDWPAAGR